MAFGARRAVTLSQSTVVAWQPAPDVPLNGALAQQLDRIALGIFDLDLVAAGAHLHLVPDTHTSLRQASDQPSQVLHFKEHAVPPARLLLPAVRHRSGPGCPGPLKIT